MSLLSLEEARLRLLALASPMNEQSIHVEDALGFYLSSPLIALRSQPAAPLSSMDGYAIKWSDMPGPWQIVGESAAGHAFAGGIKSGETVRISTGAIVPKGADTIVVQEDVERLGDCVKLTGDGPAKHAAHVRFAGNDFQENARLVEPGVRISASMIGLAVMAGHSTLPVRQKPKISILSTGDELLPIGELPQTDQQIPASNGPMLSAMLTGLPVTVHSAGIIPDDEHAIAHAMEQSSGADVIVTTGGASVGDHDHLKPALEQLGVDLDFWRVAMKPGKPVMVGKKGQTVVLGLPGNPVSAYVTAIMFLLPLVRKLCGAADPLPMVTKAQLATDMPGTGKRAEFVRATFNNGMLSPLNNQDSAALTSMAAANALIIRQANAPKANKSDETGYIALS